MRAETPSAAAELISSHFVSCAQRAVAAGETMTTLVDDALARARERLDHGRSRLRLLTPSAQIEQGYLRLDDFSNRLAAALRDSLQNCRQELAAARAEFARHAPTLRVERESHRLLGLFKRLQAASPASVLNRGFAIVRDEAGRPVARRAGLKAGQRVEAEFADGSIKAKIGE
jgi:exodeoxyribonuclease VII large subunit